MKFTEGAASSWASFRSATLLMLTNLRLLPVVNRASVSGHAKDRMGMIAILSVNRITVNSAPGDSLRGGHGLPVILGRPASPVPGPFAERVWLVSGLGLSALRGARCVVPKRALAPGTT